MQNTVIKPACKPKIVALVFFTPYAKPCDIDSTAPEPGDTAMMQEAITKVIQVAKLMRIPSLASVGSIDFTRWRHALAAGGHKTAGSPHPRRVRSVLWSKIGPFSILDTPPMKNHFSISMPLQGGL
jgi:hypothetical protein